MLIEQNSAIIFRQQQPPLLLRVFSLFLGVGMAIVIPAPFIIHADWTTMSPTLVVAGLCIVISAIAGAFFIILGLVSASELRLDPLSGQATRIMRGPVFRRQEAYPLSAVGSPEVVRRESQEDGPSYVLRMRLPKWPIVEMRDFSGRDDAEFWQGRILKLLERA